MVNNTQKWDSIDSELARAYFTPVQRQPGPPPEALKKERHSFPVRRTAAILSALTAAGLAFLLAVNILDGLKLSSRSSYGSNSRRVLFSGYISPAPVLYNEKVLYDFESGKDGWEIPAWASEKEDYRQISTEISDDISSLGNRSLRINSDFTAGTWIASLAEIQHYLDLSSYDAVAVDIYLPSDAPQRGFRAKLIFTVGEDWKFVEMSRSVKLEPGRWTYILASLKPDSLDWKWTKVDKAFKEDIRKISLRVEFEGKQDYSGPIYIDNFRVGNTGSAGQDI